MPTFSPSRRNFMIAELLAIAFVGLIAAAANRSEVSLLLFPELAALSHDVLTRPNGKWASQPLRLIATPTLAAIMGLFVTRHTHYGAIPVLLITLLSLAIIRVTRSAIGPAISAGVLPLVLDERHWVYPVAIFIGLVTLACILWIWKRWTSTRKSATEGSGELSIDDVLENSSHNGSWLFNLLAFVALLALAGQWTGLRFILFPPLVVMAYEVLGHPEVPGWIRRPAFFPLVCFLTACTGFVALRWLGNSAVSVVVTVTISIALLRVFQVHMPPALAVGLLPFVIRSPDFWYPISVGIGTVILGVWFGMRARQQPSKSAVVEELR